MRELLRPSTDQNYSFTAQRDESWAQISANKFMGKTIGTVPEVISTAVLLAQHSQYCALVNL